MSNNDIKVFVATHKKFELFGSPDIYFPIQGGAALYPNLRWGYILDCTGDNISKKKENYNELSSQYWIWKNDHSSIKGLCHYRRFFMKYATTCNPKYILDKKQIEKALSKYDAIIPYPTRLKNRTVKDALLHGSFRMNDLLILDSIMKKDYNNYYSDYLKILNQSHACYCNLMIAKSSVFDHYSEWLFDILFKMEKKVCLENYNEQEQRIFGYVGEILLNVWIKHNRIRIKYYPYAVIGSNKKGLLHDIKNFICRNHFYEVLKYRSFCFRHYL